MEFLNIYQIYFDKSQQLDDRFIPYDNTGKNTVYFENTVIVELAKDIKSEYFGVVSHSFHDKIRHFDYDEFCKILKERRPDVMAFCRWKSIGNQPFLDTQNRYHPYFKKFFKEIVSKACGLDVPDSVGHPFYFNYFVARKDVYEGYVNDMLIPCMKVMDTMPELYLNSNYKKGLPFREATVKSMGIDYYPYHPFICERLFMYYVWWKGLSVEYPYAMQSDNSGIIPLSTTKWA